MANYNRWAAVEYANRWWNDRNPDFPNFDVNCTNYVSQCINAGGIPMFVTDDTQSGWWIKRMPETELGFIWSFSWALAHSFRWFLSSDTAKEFAQERQNAYELEHGDIIVYDFDGNNVWQHSAIVTAKRQNGQPLVNANSSNSYHRDWTYKDSPAYTPQIKYRFFHLF